MNKVTIDFKYYNYLLKCEDLLSYMKKEFEEFIDYNKNDFYDKDNCRELQKLVDKIDNNYLEWKEGEENE